MRSSATPPEICSVTGHSLQGAHQILRHYLALHPEMATTAIDKMVTWYDGHGETAIRVCVQCRCLRHFWGMSDVSEKVGWNIRIIQKMQ
ncbi:hypothetical protein BC360_12295 [Ensifer sp. LC163]|nr:hypothetical protein BC360_12295 [Ensifer sp. LC163]